MSDGDRCYDKNKAGSSNNKRMLVKNWWNLSETCNLVSDTTMSIGLFVITVPGLCNVLILRKEG